MLAMDKVLNNRIVTPMTSKLNIIILAAGKGTRMYSEKPKVLHELAAKSLVEHVIATARELQPDSTTLVIGHQAEKIKTYLAEQNCNFVLQSEQKGTAHAVVQALPMLDDDALALVLYGDVPLIKPSSLKNLLEHTDENTMAVLTCEVANPTGLGRILRNEKNKITGIVEEKDASEIQKNITEINTGIMAFPVNRLKKWLPAIKNNNKQNEFYLTDIVSLALADNALVETCSCEAEFESFGVNSLLQLAELEKIYQQQQAAELMLQGVKIIDPLRFNLRGEASIDTDTELDINIILEGKVEIEKNVKIGANCILKNCTIAQGTEIYPNCIIEDAIIGTDCKVGPFARIRPGTELKTQAKIGNFVETKKALIGEGSKVNHLSYVGDSELGKEVNVGAGTITCNYDGVNKFKTQIGNNVFIGSNTALVAPVFVDDGATIGAGSTITKDIKSDQLALSRTKQTNFDGWKRPVKK